MIENQEVTASSASSSKRRAQRKNQKIGTTKFSTRSGITGASGMTGMQTVETRLPDEAEWSSCSDFDDDGGDDEMDGLLDEHIPEEHEDTHAESSTAPQAALPFGQDRIAFADALPDHMDRFKAILKEEGLLGLFDKDVFDDLDSIRLQVASGDTDPEIASLLDGPDSLFDFSLVTDPHRLKTRPLPESGTSVEVPLENGSTKPEPAPAPLRPTSTPSMTSTQIGAYVGLRRIPAVAYKKQQATGPRPGAEPAPRRLSSSWSTTSHRKLQGPIAASLRRCHWADAP